MAHSAANNLSAGSTSGAPGDALYDELWHVCAGSNVTLPREREHVYYLPQAHMEQLGALTLQGLDHRDLPKKVLCKVVNVNLQVVQETDEVYAQILLIPEPDQSKVPTPDPPLPEPPRCSIPSFCKKLTASDTGKNHGFLVPQNFVKDCLPQLDMSQQPPRQDLVATDLHGNEWHFQHIFRGRRHLITTGWGAFLSAKKLTADDHLIFLRGENGELRVGVRKFTRQLSNMTSSVISNDSIQARFLCAALQAIKTGTIFTVYYKPWLSLCGPSRREFIVSVKKYLEDQNQGLSVEVQFVGQEVPERSFSGHGFEGHAPYLYVSNDETTQDQIWDDIEMQIVDSHLDTFPDPPQHLDEDKEILMLRSPNKRPRISDECENPTNVPGGAQEVDTVVGTSQALVLADNSTVAAVGDHVIATQTYPEMTEVLDSGGIETPVDVARNGGQPGSCTRIQYSSSEPIVQSDLVPWNNFTAYAESVPVLNSILQSHPTTFEHFSNKNSCIQASILKELASYVKNISNTTVAGLEPYVKFSKDLFHDLHNANLDIGWLESRFEAGTAVLELENLMKEKILASERLDSLGEEVQELQSKLSKLEAQLEKARDAVERLNMSFNLTKNDLLFKDLL